MTGVIMAQNRSTLEWRWYHPMRNYHRHDHPSHHFILEISSCYPCRCSTPWCWSSLQWCEKLSITSSVITPWFGVLRRWIAYFICTWLVEWCTWLRAKWCCVSNASPKVRGGGLHIQPLVCIIAIVQCVGSSKSAPLLCSCMGGVCLTILRSISYFVNLSWMVGLEVICFQCLSKSERGRHFTVCPIVVPTCSVWFYQSSSTSQRVLPSTLLLAFSWSNQ